MNRLGFTCFADFFVWTFNTRVEYDFLCKIRQYKGLWRTWSKRLHPVFCQTDVQFFHSLRWNSWTTFLVKGINSSLLTFEFFSDFLPPFFLSTKGFLWIDLLFRRFFCNDFYNLRSVKISQKKGLWIAWSKSQVFVKLRPKNSISVPLSTVGGILPARLAHIFPRYIGSVLHTHSLCSLLVKTWVANKIVHVYMCILMYLLFIWRGT